jgi:hypothetical protein
VKPPAAARAEPCVPRRLCRQAQLQQDCVFGPKILAGSALSGQLVMLALCIGANTASLVRERRFRGRCPMKRTGDDVQYLSGVGGSTGSAKKSPIT